jgi:hypothetical protein
MMGDDHAGHINVAYMEASHPPSSFVYTTAVCKVRGLEAVRRCYTDGSGYCYAKLLW